jgi:hypothetical protein
MLPPVVSGVPTVSGTARVGSVLTAAPGTWGPAPVTISYQWNRAGTAISGATAATYTATASDLGKALTVTVSGTKTGYTKTSRVSAATPAVVAGTLTSGTPAITGTAAVGATLTAATGTWGPAPVTFTYQWNKAGAAIAGATAAKYVPVAADLGKTLTVTVSGNKAGYTKVTKTSAPSAAMAVGTLVAPVPRVTGTARVGYDVIAVPGTWTAGTTLKYQWYRNGIAIPGATGIKYRLTTTDFNKRLTVRVTGSKTGFTSTYRNSAQTSVIAAGFLTSPTPTIVGTLKSGYTLTAKPGTWTSGTTLKYQWYRSGVAIAGATGSSYRLVAADRYDTIRVRVVGSKFGYTTTVRDSRTTVKVP